MRSVSGDDYDCDDIECRDQRNSAIKNFRPGLCGSVGGRHDLTSAAVVRQRTNISRLHWIGRYYDFFDVIAFGAVEPAKFESFRPRRDARKDHARSAFRAAEPLNCEQGDCGSVIGHCITPLGQAERKTLSHRSMPKRAVMEPACSSGSGGTGQYCSHSKLMIGKLGRPCLFRVQGCVKTPSMI